MSAPQPKRARHVASKWQEGWRKYHLTRSRKGASYAFCTLCSNDLSIGGGGLHDIKRHVGSVKHMQMLRDLHSQPSITSAMASSSQAESPQDQVTKAEVYFAFFVAEHNLSFSTGDDFTKLCKKIFPNSKVAEKFSCARTKTRLIISLALAPAVNADVVHACATNLFTILCNGGNDKYNKKYFAIMVRYWDDPSKKTVTRFIAMPVCNIATGQTLFDALSTVLSERGIPWSHVVGFCSDSASVMVGRRNSVLSRVLNEQPQVFTLGCICHLAALCAAAGLKALSVSIDNLLIDIFYHFKHSSKRVHEFEEILADFSNMAPMRILKHCTTRWLSLDRAVQRLIAMWPALHAYFDLEKEHDHRNERVQRVASSLSSIDTKLFVHFVKFALRPLTRFNVVFQTTTSKISTMQRDILDLLRSYFSNFIKGTLLRSTDDIAYDDVENQLSNEELGVGISTLLLLAEFQDEIEGTPIETRFFSSVRLFYQETVRKMFAKFPFKDSVLTDLSLLDPHQREIISLASVVRLCSRFFTACPSEQRDDILNEFRDFRATPDEYLPTLDFPTTDSSGIESFWMAMSEITLSDQTVYRFGNLAKLCKILLVLSHGNADPERLFSMVSKIETDQRSSLLPSTVTDLISVKVNTSSECYESESLITPSLLTSAKQATTMSLSSSSTDTV